MNNRDNSRGFKYWKKGVRFYIGIGAVLVSLEAWWWAEASYAGSILFSTRLEEFYAWMAVGLLTLAISIGPFYSVWTNANGKIIMYDARRWLGISAAWFATLHATIAYVALFKAVNPLSLPSGYQQAFILGGGGLVILLAMAFTSFDKAFSSLGIWWFRLHRLIYIALILILFHAFMIGVHATQWLPLIILTTAAVFIFSIHFYLAFIRQDKPTVAQVVVMSAMFLLVLAVFNYGFGQKLGYNPIEGKSHHHS